MSISFNSKESVIINKVPNNKQILFDLSIIIPTLNEAPNIDKLTTRIKKTFLNNDWSVEVIFVDDGSDDGTIEKIKKIINNSDINSPKNGSYDDPDHAELIFKLYEHSPCSGVTAAIIDAAKLSNGKILVVMDADLSHPPEKIPELVLPIIYNKAGITVASRYVSGGGTEGWPIKRKIISRSAKLLAKIITPIKDPLAGFFAVERSIFFSTNINPVGNKVLLELLAKNPTINTIEIPYIFKEREAGYSKLDKNVISLYLKQLWILAMSKESFFHQLVKFTIVGAIGTIVNLTCLYIFVEFFNIWYLFGAIFSSFLSMSSNFLLNKYWTFKIQSVKRTSYAFFKSAIITSIGFVMNLGILYFLTTHLKFWYILSEFFAILIVWIFNFFTNKYWVFVNKNPF